MYIGGSKHTNKVVYVYIYIYIPFYTALQKCIPIDILFVVYIRPITVLCSDKLILRLPTLSCIRFQVLRKFLFVNPTRYSM